ncbi:hypothetical protein Glove_529g34 [Diversispora epigaea]|uniref:Uncharacterized protein n=1 Tax=Diversispora epigaea TaxID=1348612 RepID=A0A397GGA6_9GLOM|nr:hypothetical protein Glove_529g34 [Diversispora epigaea]
MNNLGNPPNNQSTMNMGNMGPGYQPNSTSPPPLESGITPTGQRVSTPPSAGIHKTKRQYPKQITEAYTDAQDPYQLCTPAATPGTGNLPQQPIQQIPQSQFFTPGGDQQPIYNSPNIAGVTNQFSNLGFDGLAAQVNLIILIIHNLRIKNIY